MSCLCWYEDSRSLFSLHFWMVALICAATSGRAAADMLEYNRDIRPILAEHCFACHGVDSAAREADLRLDLKDPAVDFGAIVPGDADASSLVERIEAQDADLLMPPPETKKKLSPAQISTLRKWIDEGAEYQAHWSYLPPTRPAPPQVDSETWAKNPIDHFVVARLAEVGLKPAPAADARTLCRRLHLDLTGLPPTPEAVAAFLAEYEADQDAAVVGLVDRLMASPAWGEHRARYWLDAARYADTHGMHFDNYREMWPYRDWTIRAFNNNQPFDEFTVDQLAGDLRANPTEEQLIATGFQRCNPTTNEGGTIEAENLANYASDHVQTFGWVFLGLTVNCAQCHDHKFDPISMRDYYSLAAFFRNTTAPGLDGNAKDGKGPVIELPAEADRPRWDVVKVEIAQSQRELAEIRERAEKNFDAWLATASSDSLGNTASSEGLVLHLPLNEGRSEQVADRSASASKVQLVGELVWQAEGKFGAAPTFKGAQGVGVEAAGDFEKQEPFSVGAWVKTGDPNQSASLVARMDVAAGHRGWDLWLANGTLSFHAIDNWPGKVFKVTTDKPVIVADKWQHIMMTCEGAAPENVKIYVDGKAVPHQTFHNTLTAESSIRSKAPFFVGQRNGGGQLQQASVQDLRIYNRSLAADEVEVLAKSPQLAEYLATPVAERSAASRAAALDGYLAVVDADYSSASAKLVVLEAELASMRKRGVISHIQQERTDSMPMAYVLMRGEYDQPGEQVQARTPAALHAMPEGAPGNRMGLAQWVVDPKNPLTSRVTVNRFWQELFGQGLVATAEDFGVSGELPSHPELLDWLAVEFVESGWDVQHMYRLMLTSATYRQAALATPEKLELDPANRLLSRGPRFRMDAEMVRDYALAASGLLSVRPFGPGTKPYQPDEIWSVVGVPGSNTRDYVQDKGENLYRRTLYHFWKRMAPAPNLEAFNAPTREVCAVRRERTNTPLQALVTLNDPQFVEAARRLAESALGAKLSPQEMAQFIAHRALCRPLSDDEVAIVLTSQQQYSAHYANNAKDAKALIEVGDTTADASHPPAELATWTMVASQLLNLDEVLSK
jgi:hypothetical protein